MIQDIAPKALDNQMRFVEAGPEDLVLAYRGREVLAAQDAQELCFPTVGELALEVREGLRYLFAIDDVRYFLAPEGVEAPCGYEYISMHAVRLGHPKHESFACLTGLQLYEWYRNNVFCGRCGGRTEHSESERALVCPSCGNHIYPKIAPAIIAAVTDGDRVLLTKYAGREYRAYALVAGFVEIGETAEETVAREVFEETGVRVKNVRYYKSQPWGLSGDLLLGYFAELDGSDEITVDQTELSIAEWVRREDLGLEDDGVSLTREMIMAFKRGEKA